ncbi:MAG: histidine phosphatase family protein [Nocardioidaceae bacterium]
MRNVYVVTHPEAAHHAKGLVGGWYDSHLTPAGVNAAEAIGTALRTRIPLGDEVELYSSDLQRAQRTARVIGALLDVEVTLDRGLREKSYGEAEGKPQAWLDQRFIPPPPLGERMHHDEGVPGSETKWSLATRIYATMHTILASDCERQVIVTHGFAATFVLASWIKMPLEAADFVNFRVSSGSITELRQDDYWNNRQIVELNDVTHLARS